MKQSGENYRRIVIKVGSSLLYPSPKIINSKLFQDLAREVSSLADSGKEVVLVSSGAIASAMHLLGLKQRPKELVLLQSASSIGQNELMNIYRNAFEKRGYRTAQILLTRDDFADRKRSLNAKNTLLTLLKMDRIVPIINENDAVSTDEIKFGDNDKLSALVASLISADILIILSDVDGLLDKNKKVIHIVEKITHQIKELASPTTKKTSIGGMVTKIEAAEIAIDSGIPCVIANGHKDNIIMQILEAPEKYGTLFLPKKGLPERKRWIAFNARAKGKIIIDDGAKEAIVKNNRSLLSPGIVDLEGDFNAGDVVEICGMDNICCARGIVSVASQELKQIMGKRYHREIVHRDNLVVKK
ncbi:MAG: glutamate 5-kinase [Candidatus Omnitrophica bacterium]|nr:glutamate 5-kinase [Candidatus Omnitrophota bacterium]